MMRQHVAGRRLVERSNRSYLLDNGNKKKQGVASKEAAFASV
jgi:hypothetical protein